MTDTFFGFDTSLPAEGGGGGLDDGGGGIGDGIDSEEEYDALNDETFGHAREGDWEEMHEDMVRLDRREGGPGTDSGPDSDLDINFSSVRIDNLELEDDDNESESRLPLDPSVWTMQTPSKPETPRMHHPQPHHPVLHQQQQQQHPQARGGLVPGMPGAGFSLPNASQIRICSVEEIEKSMIKQQAQQQQQIQQQQQTIHQQYHQNIGLPRPPPGFGVGSGGQPPLPLPPVSFPPPLGLVPPPMHLLSTNVPPPPPANNGGAPPPLFPINVPPPNFQQQEQQNHANFNQRLVQEIQQNHPLLNAHRPPPMGMLPQQTVGPPPHPMQPPHLQQHMLQQQQHNNLQQQGRYPHNNRQQQQQQNYHNQQNRHHHHHHHHHHHQNGKLNRYGEYDEYANLMSERDKQWLLGIQLSQLNKDTPYYNDYYFCVFRDRKERAKAAAEEGSGGAYDPASSKAHKDNTFYHPLTQQMMRNGFALLAANAHRERRNSEKTNHRGGGNGPDEIKEVPPRNYTPLQFENSLGKLQCGSVTAPRKIIDQDVVAETGAGSGGGTGGGGAAGGAGGMGGAGGGNSSEVAFQQRRSRQILLHVESLYKVVLKLEDLSNPLAIQAKQLLKERKERERLMLLERGQQQQSVDEQNNVTTSTTMASLNGTAEQQEPDDTFESLLEKLLPGLAPDGVLMVLSVRKGKLLLKRIQAVLREHPFRWNLWCAILAAIPLLARRDRDDSEDQLSLLFEELECHVKYTSVFDFVPLLDTFINTDKLLAMVPRSKFLLTTVLTLIERMEFFHSNVAFCLTPEVNERWKTFLGELAKVSSSSSNVPLPPHHILKLDPDSKIVQTVRTHLQRYPVLHELETLLLRLISSGSSSGSSSNSAGTELTAK